MIPESMRDKERTYCFRRRQRQTTACHFDMARGDRPTIKCSFGILEEKEQIETTRESYFLDAVEVSLLEKLFAAFAILPCWAPVSPCSPECFAILTVPQSCSLDFESDGLNGDWSVLSQGNGGNGLYFQDGACPNIDLPAAPVSRNVMRGSLPTQDVFCCGAGRALGELESFLLFVLYSGGM